ncbi:MAG: VOC family protein [Chloroflexota bacterium]
MEIQYLDHLVLTVRDIQTTCDFYTTVLGMRVITFSEGRKALQFGNQKINLHQLGLEFEPKATKPTPGSADMCFITDLSIDAVQAHILSCQVHIIEGPVLRMGTVGPIESLYFFDPDGNLIEVSTVAGMES